jgi:hypothetical protein
VLLRDVPPHVPGGQEDAPDSEAAGEEVSRSRHPGSLVVLVPSVVVSAVVIVIAASAAGGANLAAVVVVIIIVVVVAGGRGRRWGRLRVRDHRLRRRRGRRRRRRGALRRFPHSGRRRCRSRLRNRRLPDRPHEHLPDDDARLRRRLLRHYGALDPRSDSNDELALGLRGLRRADRRDGFLMRDHMSRDVEQAGERRSQQ